MQTEEPTCNLMANTLKQIQKSSKAIDKILQEYKIEYLHAANQRYIKLKRRKGQADSNEELKSVKQMNNYKKLNYHQKKKKETLQTILEQCNTTIEEDIQSDPTFDAHSTSDTSNNKERSNHETVEQNDIDLIEEIAEDNSSTDSSQHNLMCVNCNRHQIEESTYENIQ